MNLSGTVNALRLLYAPRQFMPGVSVATFAQLPVPIPPRKDGGEIKVVVLDKDNCFAVPHENRVFPDYMQKWEELRKHYPGDRLVIVSNTAGSSDDGDGKLAATLEANTGVKVMPHTQKKPGCHQEIESFCKTRGLITDTNQIAVVGDRLMTDVLMANLMGAQSVWISKGVVPSKNVLVKFERCLYNALK